MSNTITLKEKLKALGFEEAYGRGQYIKRDLSVYVYIKYNKIVDIQISKLWGLKDFRNYTEYLSKVNYLLTQLESTLYDVEE